MAIYTSRREASEETTRPTTPYQISSLQNREKINFSVVEVTQSVLCVMESLANKYSLNTAPAEAHQHLLVQFIGTPHPP